LARTRASNCQDHSTSHAQTGSPITRSRSNTIRYLLAKKGISFEGYLTKKGDLLMMWKACYCVLEGNTLAYYESREDFILDVGLKGRIVINSVEEESIGKPNGFTLKTEGHRTQHLASRTTFEKEQWIRAIKVQI